MKIEISEPSTDSSEGAEFIKNHQEVEQKLEAINRRIRAINEDLRALI